MPTLPLPSQFELPGHIDPSDLEILIRNIALCLSYDPAEQKGAPGIPTLTELYDACNLQPTSRACYLAAHVAVLTLLAHEIGQEVGT